MTTFVYIALKGDGSTATGELNASDRAEALLILDRKGWQPVSLKVKGDDASPTLAKAGGKSGGGDEVIKGPIRLTRPQVVLFTEELSELLGAGLQLEPALRIMENREELSNVKTVTKLLRQQVVDGTNFSTALRRSSKNFGDLYCNLAQAGEVSGALPTILKRQAQYLVTISELQSRVVFAMIYPAFLFLFGMLVAILFVTFLIPKLTGLLDSTGGQLPLAAQVVVWVGDFIKSWWWVMGLMLAGAFLGFRNYVRAEENREKWDRVKINIPFVGDILQKRFFVQYLETLSNLVSNGLPLLRALELSRNATTNLYIRKILQNVNNQVGEGASLSRTLKRTGFFPSLLIDIVTVGEQTGKMPDSLARGAKRFDKELEKSIQALTALIQPVIIFVMASLVGVLAYTMITTIFQTIQGIKK